MKFLLTGGAGFIGSHILSRLLEEGHQVRVIDNLSTGKRENIAPCLSQMEFWEGDIRDAGLVKKAVRDVDYIIHQAALPSVISSVQDPLSSHETNITGTLNILIQAKEAGVKRVVFASSCAVYGDSPELPKREEMIPNPLSPYALNKLCGEYYARLFYQLYGLETVCLRYFNVFGRRQDPASQYAAAIPIFISRILENKSITIYGDGHQSRDFIYIDNIVEANILACFSAKGAGEVFNIGAGEQISLNNLLEKIRDVLGRPFEVNYVAPRPADIRHSCADIGKATRDLGFKINKDIKEGLKLTIDWLKK